MKKTVILALVLMMLLSTVATKAAPEIAYDGTSVIVKGTVENIYEEDPVAILVLKPSADGSERDISEFEQIQNAEMSNDIIEYIGITTLDGAGSFGENGYKIKLRKSLESGTCAVYINYIGQNEFVKIDAFNHINAEELANLVGSFNDKDADYEAILSDGNLDMLSSIGIDREGYENLAGKDRFYTILKTFAPFLDGKPNENLSAALNFSESFNQSLALQELFESDNTLEILSKYNTRFWNIAIEEDDDFTLLDEEVKGTILETIKASENTRGSDIETSFLELTGLAVLRDSVIVKGDANDFILKYADVFGLDIDAFLDEELSEYKKADICNYIITNKDKVKTSGDVLKLYNDAIKSIKTSSTSGGNGNSGSSSSSGSFGGGGGSGSSIGGSSIKTPVIQLPPQTQQKEFPFGDVDGTSWAYSYIKRLYDEGVVSGKSADTFNPDDMVTREEFIKMLVEALDIELTGSAAFADVEDGKWYKPYVTAAVNAGLIQGKGDGTFGIGDKLTREDAAVILSRAVKLSAEENVQFEDKNEISSYAVNAISAMAKEGIITGYEDSTFKPKKQISRAESCAVICRILDKKGGAK